MQGIFYENWDSSYIPNILREIYLDKVYAKYFDGKKDLNIVDAGANIGLFSQFASQYAKKVVSIEPSSRTMALFKHMLDFNKITNVVPIAGAISNEDGEMNFYHNGNTTMNSLKQEVEDGTQEVEKVRTLTFGTLMAENKLDKIDFLKLDIEGSEVDVVCSPSFARVAPLIDSLVVEYHVWSGRNPQQLVNALRDYGFKVEQIPSDATIYGATRL